MRGCPDKLYDIMTQCWKEDPEKRPRFESLFDIMDNYIDFTEVYGEYRCPDCLYAQERSYVQTEKCKKCKKLELKQNKKK